MRGEVSVKRGEVSYQQFDKKCENFNKNTNICRIDNNNIQYYSFFLRQKNVNYLVI